MSFDIQDYRAFVELLYQHPEWRAELRQLVLSEELLTLPQLVRELTEAQKRTDERLDRLTQRVDELTEAQKRTDEQLRVLTQRVDELTEAQKRTDEQLRVLAQRVDELTQRVDELTEAQKRTEQRLEELAEAQKHIEQRVSELAQTQENMNWKLQRLTDRVGQMSGDVLEMKYRDKAWSYFGRILRKARSVEFAELEPLVEKHLTEEQLDDLLLIDILVRGQLRHPPDAMDSQTEVWLAVEVSSVVDREDVERAQRRAGWLRQAGLAVLPVAAGYAVTARAHEAAEARGVVIQLDGRIEHLDQAVQGLMTAN